MDRHGESSNSFPDEQARSIHEAAVCVEEFTMQETCQLQHLPEWQLACRVASSKTFSRSELLPKFLLYVCAQQLAGNTHEISEQRIGTEVFQRPHGYNPGEDNIVRNYARLLRKRLADYFEGEGENHAFRIEIPRGGYVPHFQPRLQKFQDVIPQKIEVQPDIAVNAVNPEVAVASTNQRPRYIWIASLLAAAFLGLLVGTLLQPSRWPLSYLLHKEQVLSPAHSLWMQLFQQNRDLMIVPPDSGLGILENLTGQTVTLDDYASGRYLPNDVSISGLATGNHNDLRRQRYTSMVGLKIASSLLQLPEVISNRSEIRDARDMSPEDFKNSNIILIGSIHSNPWVGLFEKNFNFQPSYTDTVDQSYVINENPVGTEQRIYRNGDGKTNRTYGVINYLPNLQNTGHVLIIQGLNMASTQAAAEILFDRNAIGPVLERAKGANGSLDKFELLIETNSIVATAPSAHIIAMRFYPT